MIVINTVSNERFSLNGVEYFKNFLSFVSGDKVAIYNAYDKNDQRVSLDLFSNFTVNGVVYGSAALLQAALLNVIYTRDTLGAVNTVLSGSITPTSTPTGTGKAFWVATQSGTYTNFGGVVVSENSFAVISRDAAGAFSISQTTFDITSKVNVSDVINTLTSSETAKPLSAAQGKILNEKIGNKANNFDLDYKVKLLNSKNLFDKTKVTSGFRVSGTTGELVAATDLNASDFIKVLPSTDYFFSESGVQYRAFYDENRIYISGVDAAWVGDIIVATPSNCQYMKVTVHNAYLNAAQLELGTAVTTYEPYYEYVDPTKLKSLDDIRNISAPQNEELKTWLRNPSYIYDADDQKAIAAVLDFQIIGANPSSLYSLALLTKNDVTYFNRIIIREGSTQRYINDFTEITPTGVRELKGSFGNGISFSLIIDYDKIVADGIIVNKSPSPIVFSAKCFKSNISTTTDKTLAVLGDSIMMLQDDSAFGENRTWASLKTKLGLRDVYNLGVGGATWQDRLDVNNTSTPTPSTLTAFISNEIRWLKRIMLEGKPTPDIIIVSAGTNNATVTGDFATIMAMSFSDLEASESSRTTLYGGLRYCLEILTRDFPNASIIIFSPIQSAGTAGRIYDTLKLVCDAIKKMAGRYSVPFINSLDEIGIVENYEVIDGVGRYLQDGLHPNDAGKVLFSNFYAKKIEQNHISKL